ncbi:MAG TPA: potassium channel family protein [Steroidobacteraceae bacterium]|nr:potassium channel family protein [Steroidobacteraceae bacterium]
MNSTLLLTLRRLRAPIILLVVVFAIGIVGLVLIPGVDEQGRPWRMSVFQAFYFMTYTASTIGFGEIPQGFTDRQRLWVTAIIFASVFGWAFLVASLLSLGRDKALRRTLVESRFHRRVEALVEPFYLICGFGETGQLIAKALDLRGRRFVVLEIDETRAQEVDLMDFRQVPLALAADASLPDNLAAAGLRKDQCRGVLALTNDDQANLAVAMTVRLLEPSVPVLARAMSRDTAANMASFDTDHIINPFARFGEQLALAIAAPANYRLVSWLTGLPGTHLKPETAPPRGAWVVCGYGRFGREVVRAFHDQGLEVTVIDPLAPTDRGMQTVQGLGTEAEPLVAAGIGSAVGIVAGTDDDVNNLSIVVTARELNPALFTIVRQNLQAYRALFDAFDADMTMVSSELIAMECLAVVRTPLLAPFLQIARNESDGWANALVERLQTTVGERAPAIWSVTMNISEAPAVYRLLMQGGHATIGDLLTRPSNRSERLPCLPLYLRRGEESFALPEDGIDLEPGDQVLFAGRGISRQQQQAMLRNEKIRDYVLTGNDAASGWFWQRLQRTAPPARRP